MVAPGRGGVSYEQGSPVTWRFLVNEVPLQRGVFYERGTPVTRGQAQVAMADFADEEDEEF